MKKLFLFAAVAAFALSLSSCGGGDSSSKFALSEYVAIMKDAVKVSQDLGAKLEKAKDLGDLEKLANENQAELAKYKDAVNALSEKDLGKEITVEIAEGAPFVLAAPLKLGKTIPYSDAIWVKLEGEVELNGAVTLPEGKKMLCGTLNVLDKEGNVIYTRKNLASFPGVQNEEGLFVVAADSKAKVGEYILIKDDKIEDWAKAAKLQLAVEE